MRLVTRRRPPVVFYQHFRLVAGFGDRECEQDRLGGGAGHHAGREILLLR
jgi:hypothetical protein